MNLKILFSAAALTIASMASGQECCQSHPPAAAVPPAEKKQERHSPFEGLTNHEGRITEAKDFLGKNIVLYFGYPDCKAICPVATGNIVTALKQAEKNAPGATQNILPVFITSKSGYTVEQIKEWRDRFNGESVGAIVLTGEAGMLDLLHQGFRVLGPDNTHTPFAYLINEDGKLVRTVQTQEGPEPLREAIETNLVDTPKPAPQKPSDQNHPSSP